MGKKYYYKPDLPCDLYLTPTGKSHKQLVLNNIMDAINNMEAAARELRKIEGLNTEALANRLDTEIVIYRSIFNMLYWL